MTCWRQISQPLELKLRLFGNKKTSEKEIVRKRITCLKGVHRKQPLGKENGLNRVNI